MKKRFFTTKMIIPAIILVAVMLTGMIVGFSGVFAEPDMREIVGEQDFGEFKPNYLVKDGQDYFVPVSWMETKVIGFQADIWSAARAEKETGDPEKQDLLTNVYNQEGVEGKMFFDSITNPILQPISEEGEGANYYVVCYSDLKNITGVQAHFYVGENAENGLTLDASKYFYDESAGYLYISKDVLESRLLDGVLLPLRAETAFVFEDINTVSKNIKLITEFGQETNIPEKYKDGLANRMEPIEIKASQMGDIHFRLVDSHKLALFSQNNMKVFVNGIEFENWIYNENTGFITMSANILSVDTVMVEIYAINDVTDEELMTQQKQADDELAPSAASLETVVRDYNEYIDYLQYDDNFPVVGTFQPLDYVARVMLGVTDNGNAKEPKAISVASDGKFPSAVLDLLTENAKDNGWLNGYLKSVTWSTVPVLNGQNLMNKVTRPSGVPNTPSDMSNSSYTDLYGEIAYYLYKASKGGDSTYTADKYIEFVNKLANAYLFNFNVDAIKDSDYRENNGNSESLQWPTNRLVDARWHTHAGTGQSRYVGGIYANKTFLGGEVHGTVLIDGDCCQITASASWVKDLNQAMGNQTSTGTNTDYQCGSSIIAVTDADDLDSNGYGSMWVCSWSESIQDTNADGHAQRIQSYSKIKFKYQGEGTLRFEKLNKEGAKIGGAVYEIYQKGSPTVHKTITTSSIAAVEVKLRKGDYVIKEKTPPTGYLKDNEEYSITIKVNETTDVEVVDPYQLCKVEFTVYDKTTKGNTKEVPVAGISFKLEDGNGSPVKFRDSNDNPLTATSLKTDGNGKISFYVRTLDVTPAIQTVNGVNALYLVQIDTVENYRKTLDLRDEDYCHKILISANTPSGGVCPDNSGKNTSTTKKHYENRQWVDIKAHVQDSTLLSATTMSEFGGYDHDDGSTQVRLTGSKYRIMTSSEKALVGYTDSGKAIYLKPNILLGYAKGGVSDDDSRPVELLSFNDGNPNSKAYIEISSVISTTRATVPYTEGLTLSLYNLEVDGVSGENFSWSNKDKAANGIHTKITTGKFELPNAVYQLVLDVPGTGYHRYENEQDKNSSKKIYDGTGINAQNITTVDGSWINSPSAYEQEILAKESEIVIQERQTVSIEAYVKGYIAADKKTAANGNGYMDYKGSYTISNFSDAAIQRFGTGAYYDSVYSVALRNLATIQMGSIKEVRTSNANGRIAKGSTEYVTVYKQTSNSTSAEFSVNTIPNNQAQENGLNFDNVILELYNLTTIVDVRTGKVIPALNSVTGTKANASPIGRYKVGSDGYIKIDKLSSGKIDNPFPEATTNQSYIPAANALMYQQSLQTLGKGEISSNELPNGVYYIKVLYYDENTQTEKALSENILFDTAWSTSRYTEENISHDSLHLIQTDPNEPSPYHINIAPDLPNSITDGLRYNPDDVVGTKNQILIGDELDITKVLPSTQAYTDFTRALQWIDKHSDDYSYRIFEMINNDSSDDTPDDYNVNTEIVDNLPTTFAMYINHNVIPEAHVEYHYYTQYFYEVTKAEFDSASAAEKKANYRVYADDSDTMHYYKKFTSNEMLNTFVFNSDSAGYIRYFEGGYEIDANKPVTGAVYNIDWLSRRMATSSVEGTYRILIEIDVEKTTYNWITGTSSTDHLNRNVGTIKIKNRQLFDLD